MDEKQLPTLAIVVPCYNEEDVLPETMARLTEVLLECIAKARVHPLSRIVFVDDGSSDRTWKIIAMESVKNSLVTGIKLARNSGHQHALLAGLETVRHMDCSITIDADLQDDIHVIEQFLEKFSEGYDIVYGVRRDRSVDSPFKKYTALLFYRLLQKMGIPIIENHADFRLMSKRAMHELLRYQEWNPFLRGLIPLTGLPATKVYYDRKARLAGETKYPLKKMLAFAIDGITSFTVLPIRFITLIGIVFVLVSLGIIGLGFADYLFKGEPLLYTLSFLAGLQLLSIGILGEYIGKMFWELKDRPKYTIEIDLFSQPMLGKWNEEQLEQEKRQERNDRYPG